MSTAIEISTILATPKVTKTNNILDGTISPQSYQNTFWIYLAMLSESFARLWQIFSFCFQYTANTSSDFYKSYRRWQAKFFSP